MTLSSNKALTLEERVALTPRDRCVMFGQRATAFMAASDMLLVEWIFAENPHLESVVELGCARGLTTLYLSMIVLLRKGQLHSFDVNQPDQRYQVLWPGCVTFHRMDVLKEQHPVVVKFASRPNTLVICDNGDKVRELELYASVLAPSSIIVAHNFGAEVAPKPQWKAIIDRAGLAPYLWGEAAKWKSSFRAWRKKEMANGDA